MKSKNNYITDAYQAFAGAIAIAIVLCMFLIQSHSPLTLPLYQNHGFELSLSFGIDGLSKLMACVVILISGFIFQYAKCYMDSDPRRLRFLVQLTLVSGSVLVLIFSNNLLTAFIGWQFIGLNLYLLLNHNHEDWIANRSAKKKFIINRLGDLCFLIAVALCLNEYGTTNFNVLFAQAVNPLIPALIFIAVMTKSAQFPFHIWLPDTLEAPTPVSALMHAGVINAGGFLLARLSPLVTQSTFLMGFILVVGAITAVMGMVFYHYQVDIKKKLAYSTMGQMGYMVFQCGLGAFSAAVFHLIAHGFYKASLFLNSGNTLLSDAKPEKNSRQSLLISTLLTLFSILIISAFSNWIHYQFEPLILTFLAISFLSIYKQIFSKNSGLKGQVFSVLLMLIIGIAYVLFLKTASHIIGLGYQTNWIKADIQWHLSIAIFLIAFLLQYQVHRSNRTVFFRKANIECFYRNLILEPLRSLGDFCCRLTGTKGQAIFLIVALVLCLTAIFESSSSALNMTGLSTALGVIIFSALVANRCKNLACIFFWLAILEISFIGIILFKTTGVNQSYALFHLINMIPIFALLMAIARTQNKHYPQTKPSKSDNKLPWLLIYLGSSLLLLIGIPGSASFFTELFVFSTLLKTSASATTALAIGFFLLSVVVMHALQTSVFNKDVLRALKAKASPSIHLLAILTLAINVFNGCYPHALMLLIGA